MAATTEDLNKYESDLVEFLSNMEPVQPNLFMPGKLVWDKGTNSLDCRYRIESVGFDLPNISYNEERAVDDFLIEKVTFGNEVTINWRDDVFRSIQKYHFDWFNSWYNRYDNALQIGATSANYGAKTRTLTIYMYHFTNSSDTLFSVPKASLIATISFNSLRPMNFGTFKFSQSADSVGEILECKYKAKSITISYEGAQEKKVPDASVKALRLALGNQESTNDSTTGVSVLQNTVFLVTNAKIEGVMA